MTAAITSASNRFDYAALDIDPQKKDELRQAADHVRQHRRKVGASIITIGQALLAAKSRLPHGQFGPWLEAEFNWTDRTARNFMMAAEQFEGKPEIVSDLQPTTIYLLASPSTPAAARDDFIMRRERGEHVPDEAVRSLISMAKGEGLIAKKHKRLSAEERRRNERRDSRADRRRKEFNEGFKAVSEARRLAEESAAAIIIKHCRSELPELMRNLDYCPGYGLLDAIRKQLFLEEHAGEAIPADDVPPFVVGRSV